MRVLLQPAFILHRRPYRNTSLLLDALSRDHGRIALVARGATAPRSRLKGVLQPFTPLLLSWSGADDLATLIGAEASALPTALPPHRILAGLYVNELLVRLLRRLDPQPVVFAAYQTLLTELAQAASEEPALRGFEKQLLDQIGYGLSLDCEAVSGQPIVAETQYCYVLDQGPLTADRNAVGVPISGQGLLALRDGRFADPEVWREIKHLTRAALAEQLRGRALKTRELYRFRQAPLPK
jgi:DNA repair protein RecO (recombination protein O)